MSHPPESGHRPPQPTLLNRLLNMPAELRKFADRQYYLRATSEGQRQEAVSQGELFIREAVPFLLQPDTLSVLAFNPYEEGVLRNFADCLAEGNIGAGNPSYIRLEWSSPGYIQGLSARTDTRYSALHYTWDTGLQYPVSFTFAGIDMANRIGVTSSFIVLDSLASELGLPVDETFRTYENGKRIHSKDTVKVNGSEQTMEDEYRYVGNFCGGKTGATPYFIYVRKKHIMKPVREHEDKKSPSPIPPLVTV